MTLCFNYIYIHIYNKLLPISYRTKMSDDYYQDDYDGDEEVTLFPDEDEVDFENEFAEFTLPDDNDSSIDL